MDLKRRLFNETTETGQHEQIFFHRIGQTSLALQVLNSKRAAEFPPQGHISAQTEQSEQQIDTVDFSHQYLPQNTHIKKSNKHEL